MLDTLTIALILSAGLLHASWHSLVKYGGDQNLIFAGMGLVAAAFAAFALPFLPVPSSQVWPVIAGSVILHVAYKLSLAQTYALGDLGQAYPLARGFVPLFSTLIALVLFGQAPSLGQALGIAVVSLGLLWLAINSVRGDVDRRLFLVALVAGVTVAGYSVVDAYGTRLSGNWASFTAWLVVVDSLVFGSIVYGIKGQILWRELWRQRMRILVSGGLGLASFSVFLWALSRNSVGPISALRECSILFSTVIGMAIYKEDRSLHKIGASTLLIAGLLIFSTAGW